MAKITLEVPLVDEVTLKAFGVTQQDFVDDLGKVTRLWAVKMQMELKDALHKQMTDGKAILPEVVREVFRVFDEATARLARVCHDEARRQQKARWRKRDEEDRVSKAIRERESTRT